MTAILDKDDTKIAADIDEKFSRSKQSKTQMVTQATLQLAYVLDQPFSYVDQATGEFVLEDDYEIRKLRDEKNFHMLALNFFKPVIRWLLYQSTSRQPQLYLLQKTAGDKAKSVAKQGTELLTYFRFKGGYLTVEQEAKWWAIVTGKAYKMTHPDEDNKDVEQTVFNIFELFGTPGVKTVRKMPWLIIARSVDKSGPENKYDLELAGSPAYDFDINPQIGVFGSEIRDNQVLVKEYYELPSKKSPKGAHIVMIDDKVVEKNPFPYKEKTSTGVKYSYRITEYDYEKTRISHFSQGLVGPALAVSKKINMLVSCWLTNVIQTAGIKLVGLRKLKLTLKNLTNIPSVFQVENMDDAPKFLEHAKMNPDVQKLFDTLVGVFKEITGVPDVAMGEEPEQRLPYLAIAHLNEKTTEQFGSIFDMWEEAARQEAFDIINTYKQFFPKAVYRILDENQREEVKVLLADKLDDFDIIAERGSSMPESKAGQIGMILEFMKEMQLDLNDPALRMQVMSAIEQGWAKEMITDMTAAMEMAKDENRRMLAGDTNVKVNIYHNHPIHLQGHSLIFESPDYKKVMLTDIEKIVMNHNAKHEEFMAPPPQPQPQPQPQPPMELPMVPAVMPPMDPGALVVPPAAPPMPIDPGMGAVPPEIEAEAAALGLTPEELILLLEDPQGLPEIPLG